MHTRDIQFSALDKSVNFIYDNDLEARYIRREKEKVLIYLSSQQGCKQACRFCHLTQTGQTNDKNAYRQEIISQADRVLDYYDLQVRRGEGEANQFNFNFMARGEPLANSHMLNIPEMILDDLGLRAETRGGRPKINISTIMPEEALTANLSKTYGRSKVPHHFYYSLYSLNPEFRKRWLPRTANPGLALAELKKWQDRSGFHLILHHAFIEGENDSLEDVEKFLSFIRPFDLQVKFNAVRYNPYSAKQGRESSEEVIQRNFAIIEKEMTVPGSRVVPRVGFDVKASCGCFIETQKVTPMKGFGMLRKKESHRETNWTGD